MVKTTRVQPINLLVDVITPYELIECKFVSEVTTAIKLQFLKRKRGDDVS